ncbi:MFS transporter [Nocardioides panaciterrulae]|uniref:MFS family permease n=1 Tax=Nocardioides panaciterrulae TaxID=661492 RepID=A0A7Y9E946_9ACTN|nr:MFS family permease [Nocardioides panaciterrulae]
MAPLSERAVGRLLDRVLPPNPLARRLCGQSVLFAVGEGVFFTGSAVFFTQVVGLSSAQVGLGLTIAGVVTFFFAVPLGRLADRVGPKRMWALGALAEALLYLAWPLISGFWAYAAMMVVLELVSGAGGAGRGAYTLDLFSREERVRSLAFMRAALNIGFSLGALLAGLALAANSLSLIRMVPLAAGAILAANALLISRLPHAGHAQAPGATTPPKQLINPGALRNKGFLALNVCDGVLSTNQVLLSVVIPLWLVQETDAPRVLLAWLVGTNTVMAVLLQVAASRGAETVPGALRAARRSAAFFVLSCLIVMVTHSTLGWVTIALVWVGHVTVTGAELYQSAAHWGLVAELSDPERRGEYQGAARLGGTVGSVWAPAAYTFLAMTWGTAGWLLIGAVVVLATIGIHPATRAAERFLRADHTANPAGAPA